MNDSGGNLHDSGKKELCGPYMTLGVHHGPTLL